MGTWEFVLVYLAAFVLIQLAVYRYLRGDEDDAGPAWAGPPSADRGVPDERPDRAEPPERRDRQDRGSDGAVARRCHNCGARNDADGVFTFCRNCASRLPG